MRYAIRSCYDQRSHSIHVSPPSGDPETRYICGGDYAGDRRIRDAESLADLVAEVEAERGPLVTALERVTGRSFVGRTLPEPEPIEPDEPDYDYDYEADREADRYERNVLGF